jgi:hypothetical protein
MEFFIYNALEVRTVPVYSKITKCPSTILLHSAVFAETLVMNKLP